MFAVHTSPYSGSWYPADASELERLLNERFEQSSLRVPFLFPDGAGFVVPHAGPEYSGAVAAAVYRALSKARPERVVLLAFPHRGGLKGVAAPQVSAIATPLGEAPIDPAFGGFPQAAEDRLCDHSFEIQLPFLQHAVPDAKITPLYVGRMGEADRNAAADALADAWQPGVVFVASSDFTHYGRNFGFTPFPAAAAAAGRIRDLDFECIEAAAAQDPALFLRTLEETGATVCGADPIALLLAVLRRLDLGLYQAVLDYQTSGEITGDFNHSVSYAALGFFPRHAFDLARADCELLMDGAAANLTAVRQTGERRESVAPGGGPALAARRGVFVSLHKGKELLGCVGSCAGQSTLSQDVADLTLSAALDDPRFRPAASLAGPIDIEISVLTPFRRITKSEECQVGRHGLFLQLGERAGLLLPQVASERNWTSEEFLQAVARKASVGPRAWRDPKAKLYVFEAQVFSRSQAVP